MKKSIFTLLLIVSSFQITFAQDLNTIISDFEQSENAQVQRINKETLRISIEMAKASDATREITSQLPPFMERLELIEIMDLSQCSQEVKNKFVQFFDSIEDGNGYETLTSATEDTDRAHIMAKKDGTNISEVLIMAVDSINNDIAVVRMAGDLNESDIDDIVKQQQK